MGAGYTARILAIAGAHSNVGKTTLSRALGAHLPGSVRVKIGHGSATPCGDDNFYAHDTPLSTILRNHGNAPFLIIESNSILAQCEPDCLIYLPGTPVKPSAAGLEQRADIVRGTPVSQGVIERLGLQLGVDSSLVKQMCWLAGARPEPLTGVILAGGESRRMGRDKSLIELQGTPLVSRLALQLTPLVDSILIVGSSLNADHLSGGRVIVDKEPGLGPLMGVATALAESQTRLNFVVACDIPEIFPPLVYRLLAQSTHSDIVIPSFAPGTQEPLYGVYSKVVASQAALLLGQAKRRVAALFDICKTAVVNDDQNGWYANLNTPQDMDAYLCATPRGGKVSL